MNMLFVFGIGVLMDGMTEWRWKMNNRMRSGDMNKHNEAAFTVPKGGRFSERGDGIHNCLPYMLLCVARWMGLDNDGGGV